MLHKFQFTDSPGSMSELSILAAPGASGDIFHVNLVLCPVPGKQLKAQNGS